MIAILILLIILLVLACVKCKKENFQDKTTMVEGDKKFLSKYVSTGLMLVIVFFILCVNFFALSLALQCNKEENAISRAFIGLFAFMFSFLYIIFSYYMFRVRKGEVCNICTDNPFPF